MGALEALIREVNGLPEVTVYGRVTAVLVERGSQVDEQWFLDLERKHFVALAQMPKTQERIAHTLKTGKPLRN